MRFSPGGGGPQRAHAQPGFSLIELLVVMGVVSILLAILGTAVVNVRGSARDFMCKNQLRTVAFEFLQFADPFAHAHRGDSDRFGRGFRIEDFQESLYRIDEFWDGGAKQQVTYEQTKQPLMCAQGPRKLVKTRGLPCSSEAVTPLRNVSIGFNMRLDKASVMIDGRMPVLQNVRLTTRILERPLVPLAFDVDGAEAQRRVKLPYYSAPPAGDTGRYGNGQFWYPSRRHGGKVNACFVGGHVLASARPEAESGWDWRYQPRMR